MSRLAVSVTKSRLDRYQLPLETFEALLELQDHRCAICNVQYSRKAILERCALVIDHDHSTGKVRGLLCSKCNTALGQFKDRRDLLVAAAAYLQIPPTDMLGVRPDILPRIETKLRNSTAIEICEYLEEKRNGS